jgi:NAD(P)-dependent dehydrogenase (short-subunit alcohol dehydrogenase family)
MGYPTEGAQDVEFEDIARAMSENKVILITGASAGIGRACFNYLTEKGHVVYGVSRSPSDSCQMRQMDVTSPDSIRKVVDDIFRENKRIDGLINNAGISTVGAAEDTTIEEAKLLMETNFWGVVNMNNAILPIMRQQGWGKIIHISSLAGLFALPFQSYYSASKYAIEGYCESLRMEVSPFNIHVSLIEPGDFQTCISQNRIITEGAFSSAYREACQNALEIVTKGEEHGGDSMKIAMLVEKIMKSSSPRLRYLVGKPIDVLAARLKPYLPQRIFQRLVMIYFKV